MPGLSWVITDVKVPELDISEQSIRPAMISAGLHIPIIRHAEITIDGRSEATWQDYKKDVNGDKLNITGLLSALAGFKFSF